VISPFDAVVIIVAGGVVVNGALDRVRGIAKDRRAERALLVNGPEPICGCGHHLAYHDLHDGRCYAEVKRKQSPATLAGDGGRRAEVEGAEGDARPESGTSAKDVTVWHRCQCRRYAGPEPLATLYAPQLTAAASTLELADMPEEPTDADG
jgi:hypothetical protein